MTPASPHVELKASAEQCERARHSGANSLVAQFSKGKHKYADLLLDLVRTHRDRLHAWLPDDPLIRELRSLVEARRRLVADRVGITNRLTAMLKQYFPQALEWAGPLD